jgi:Flp pilus assembly pilin Flp
MTGAVLRDERETKQTDMISDLKGVTALEYGIVASLLGLVLVSIFRGFGSTLSALFAYAGLTV